MQLELFSAGQVAALYKANPDVALDNKTLYSLISERYSISKDSLGRRVPIGAAASLHSPLKRGIRWMQQTLKQARIIERVKGTRGVWRLTEEAKRDLHPAKPGVKLLAFRTDLGMAVWGASEDIFKRLTIPITLCFTSPPYCLREPRAYGNPDEREIVDFICTTLEPVIDNLAEDGSLVLNVTQDVFLAKSPARSTYLERLVLTICDRFGLSLMDRIVWQNPSRPPGPVLWASRTRQQLNFSYEPILWFAKNPILVKADNRRVLEPHSERHLKLMEGGGEKRTAEYGDGAFKIRPGSYGRITEGKIPRNVLVRGHRCAYGNQYRHAIAELGLPAHGAGQPFSVPEFLIRFLTEEKDLVVDSFGGRIMTGLAAELNGRAWMCGEKMLEYVRGGAELFRNRPGFWLNPHLATIRR